MKFSIKEQEIMISALLKAKAEGETKNFEIEKQILDSYGNTSNENNNKTIQMMYEQLLQKIRNATWDG